LKSKKLYLNIDGASRGNPGPAGIGIVIRGADKKKLKELYKYIGETTNNVAEYTALVYGLEEALILKADEVTVNVDSELVAKQLTGEYRVKDDKIKPLFDSAAHMLSGFKSFEIKHIDRSENKEADRLANKAINLANLV
jgi:ribonuclease HI